MAVAVANRGMRGYGTTAHGAKRSFVRFRRSEIFCWPIHPVRSPAWRMPSPNRANCANQKLRRRCPCPLMGWFGRAPPPASKRSWQGASKVIVQEKYASVSANSQAPLVVGRGVVTQEMSDAGATGPDNEIDTLTSWNGSIWTDSISAAVNGRPMSRERAIAPCTGSTVDATYCAITDHHMHNGTWIVDLLKKDEKLRQVDVTFVRVAVLVMRCGLTG